MPDTILKLDTASDHSIPAMNLPWRRESPPTVLAIPSQAALYTLKRETNKRNVELIFNWDSGFPALSPLLSSHPGFRPPAQPPREKPQPERQGSVLFQQLRCIYHDHHPLNSIQPQQVPQWKRRAHIRGPSFCPCHQFPTEASASLLVPPVLPHPQSVVLGILKAETSFRKAGRCNLIKIHNLLLQRMKAKNRNPQAYSHHATPA